MRWDIFVATSLLVVVSASASDAAWQSGGVQLSPTPEANGAYFLTGLVADDAGGAIAAWKHFINHPADASYTYSHDAQHVTIAGEIAPGWPTAGVPFKIWGQVLPGTINVDMLPIVSDGVGGAFQPLISQNLSVDYTWALELYGIGGGGSVQNLGPNVLLGLYSATQAALDADGAGGTVLIAVQKTYGSPAPPQHIFCQRVDATGTAMWAADPDGAPGPDLSPALVNPDAVGMAAISDGSGGAFFAWATIPGADIYVQHVMADGSLAAGWPTGGVAVCTAPGAQYNPRLARGGAGSVFVGWTDTRDPGTQAYVAALDAAGVLAAGCPVNGRKLGYGFYAANGVAIDEPREDVLDLQPDVTGGALVLRRTNLLGTAASLHVHRVSTDGMDVVGWPDGGRFLGFGRPESGGALCPDGAGGAFAVSPTFSGLLAFHLTSTGTDAPGWTSGGDQLSSTSDLYAAPCIVRSQEGAIAAWTDLRDPAGPVVYAARLAGDGPVAIALSLESADAEPDRAIVRWFTSNAGGLEATVWRRTEATDWVELGSVRSDGTGRLVYEDRSVVAGTKYGYRLDYLDNGVLEHSGEAWLVIPAPLQFTLEPPRPNPATGPITASVVLDNDATAVLDMLDVSGRRVLSRVLVQPGVGRHEVELRPNRRLSPGLYFLRLTQGDRSSLRRFSVIR